MIRGHFVPRRFPQPLIQLLVEIPDLAAGWKSIRFIIDTGAAVTCVHALDAMRQFGASPGTLDPVQWVNASTLAGVGGRLAYGTFDARYAFRHDDGALTVIEAPIHVGELRSGGTPALLGWDLLRLFRIEIDGPGQSISLDRSES